MVCCRDCNFYEEDDGMKFCNHPNFVPDPFGLDMPEDIDCDDFEKFHNKDEIIIGIASREDIDFSLDIF
jgi:hypothetical protein